MLITNKGKKEEKGGNICFTDNTSDKTTTSSKIRKKSTRERSRDKKKEANEHHDEGRKTCSFLSIPSNFLVVAIMLRYYDEDNRICIV